MTSFADRTIAALRANHEDLAALVAGLTEDQLSGPSAASDWTVAQVLSHLGSGAEINLAGLLATVAGDPAPGGDFNQGVWDRWNAMTPVQQAQGFLEHDVVLVEAYESLTPNQREDLAFNLGFLPFPLTVAGAAGMRLSEAAQHTWDVQAGLDPAAGLSADAAALLLEHFSDDNSFMLGFIGKADQVTEPVVLDLHGYRLAIGDGVVLHAPAVDAPDATATFSGPPEAAVRLLGGRLTAPFTPLEVGVAGNVTLSDLRRVFPGF